MKRGCLVVLAALAVACGEQEIPLVDVAQVSAGVRHTCARLVDGTVRCWGDNAHGALGVGTTDFYRLIPPAIAGLSGVAEVSAGQSHTCARLNDGTARCWGANDGGQLGDGSTTERTAPTAVPGLTGVAQIVAAAEFTVARMSDGTVRSWGSNGSRALGYQTLSDQQVVPRQVEGVAEAVEIAVGCNAALCHTCARRSNGTVLCWGMLFDGYAAYDAHSSPTVVASATGPVEIASGGRLNLARMADGTVRQWNAPRGTSPSSVVRLEAVVVRDLAGVAGLAVGAAHSCVRMQDASVRCWGSDEDGQLGIGRSSQQPAPVPGLTDVAQIAAGDGHTCAVLSDRTVHCWGNNTWRQLGDGTNTSRGEPRRTL